MGDRKMPLILLPGLLSNQTLWQHQIRYLRDIVSMQVICASQDTPEKMIQAILKQAPSKFSLAGHSMGGWLCLEIMRIAPERVSQLCLVNTTSRADSEEKRKKRQEMILKTEQGKFQGVVGELVDHFVCNPLAKEDVKKMFLEVGKETFIHQEMAMLKRQECQSILPTIRCPTLIIHATQDKNFSSQEHRELATGIQHAKLALVEDSGHMSPIEMPQAVTSLLRVWLTYFCS